MHDDIYCGWFGELEPSRIDSLTHLPPTLPLQMGAGEILRKPYV